MPEQTHREQAQHIRGKLAEQFETLMLLERELERGSEQNLDGHRRTDLVAKARAHVRHAMDALEQASRA